MGPRHPSHRRGGGEGSLATSESFIHAYVSTRTIRERIAIDDVVELALDHASADRLRGRSYTGVRAWFAYCEDVMGVPA